MPASPVVENIRELPGGLSGSAAAGAGPAMVLAAQFVIILGLTR